MSEEETQVTPQVSSEILYEAESQGWVPKERYRGNEADWVDANTFVKRGREILPILRKNNENLVRDLNNTREQLKEFKEQNTQKRFETWFNKNIKTTETVHNGRLNEDTVILKVFK